MGLRDKLGRVEGSVSGIEVRVGLMTGVDISSGEESGVVVDKFFAAIRLEARSGNCSWCPRRFPNEEPLTEREGDKGTGKTGASTTDVAVSDITTSSSLEWRQNVSRTRRKAEGMMMMLNYLKSFVVGVLLCQVLMPNEEDSNESDGCALVLVSFEDDSWGEGCHTRVQ